MLIWLIFAVLTALCLIIVLLPLARGTAARPQRGEFDLEIYRDQLRQLEREIEAGVLDATDAEAARLEVSRRLLAAAPENDAVGESGGTGLSSLSRWATGGVAVAVPLLAMSVYLVVGSPNLPGKPFVERQQTAIEQQDMAALITKVEEHLRNNPVDGRGWKIIAPAYLQQGRFRDAAAAYGRVLDIDGRDPEVLTNYAEALVMSQQGLVTEDARAAFLEAVLQDKAQVKAVFYLGLAESQDGKPEAAIKLWQKLLDDGAKDAPWRPVVEAQIRSAQNTLTGAPQLTDEQLATAENLSTDERNEMVDAMVSRLAQRLEENGKDLDGWLRLAQAYTVLGRKDDARKALDKAHSNFADDAASVERINQVRVSFGLVAGSETAKAPALSDEQVAATKSMTPEERRQMIEGMVARLAERLQDDGKDLDGWLRLMRAYGVLRKPDDARKAVEQARSNFAGDQAALDRIDDAAKSLGFDVAASDSPPGAPALTQEQIQATQDMSQDDRRQMIEGMVARLASRLEEDGKDLDGWLRLARSYAVLGRRDDARDALDKAAANFSGDQSAISKIDQARANFGLNSE